MENLLSPILDNLLGYDLIIILIAAGTFAYFLFIRWYTSKVYNILHTQGYLPDDVYDEEERTLPSKASIKSKKNQLRKMRETSEKYYSMFSNLASIFPLLGILGTVIALIPLVQHIEDMQQDFFVALTSTLWGLIFAICFKVLDALLAPRIERNDRGIEDYLERLESKLDELKLGSEGFSGVIYDSEASDDIGPREAIHKKDE